MKKILLVVALSGLMISGMASPAFAQEGFYLGGGISYNTIGGDLDIDSALGYEILLGFGLTPAWALELSYAASRHDIEWHGASLDADYSVFSADGKYSFRKSKSTQPYILLGLGIHRLVIDGPSTKSTVTCDPMFFQACVTTPADNGDTAGWGWGVNLGAGVDHYFTHNFSAGTGLTYHTVKYNNLGHNGNGFSLNLNTAYHF